MTITVKFFASLREEIGQSELQLDSSNPMTVEQIWSQVCHNIPLHPHILTAINMQYVDKTTIAKTGDEVAFFPPVTGG